MKDNFSDNSAAYLQYRPSYPDQIFAYLKSVQPDGNTAWDCGTGNGQIAQKLTGGYAKVYATDISQAQTDRARRHPDISYSVQPAEKTNFPDHFFDLIIVGQAVHWFDFDQFYAEVNRTAKENALIVIIGYGRLRVSPEVDRVIDHFYREIIGSYWDKERKYVDENYQTIPFPFEELKFPDYNNNFQWNFDHLMGYLGTWSAVKHYSRDKGANPLSLIERDLKLAWGDMEKRKVTFPVLLRAGKIKKSSVS